MRLLVTGASGLLGSKITKLAMQAGHKTYSGYFMHQPKNGEPVKIDLKAHESVLKIIQDTDADIIIHCAALTNVDICEVNRDLAKTINVDGTKSVIRGANDSGSFLAYISTDYVFDGIKGNYTEEDETKPVNFYGNSKLLGEKAVTKESKDYLIARTSVVYGDKPASGKTNFALWLIENLKANKEIKILTDQFSSPTLNTNAAKMILEACEKKLNGTYHMAGESRISRYDFAVRLADKLNLDKSLIKKARTEDMQWKAPRPRDSSLNTLKAQNTLKTKPMSLDEALIILKEELDLASRNNN
ncbi:dTDP-4-dehydrorhamnose reductase [[Eubacterium] cellulosolvens]